MCCASLFIVFKAKPPLPPSVSAARASTTKRPTFHSYVRSIKGILSQKSYILLLLTYGVNVGVFYAVSTLLNQTVLQHFPVRYQLKVYRSNRNNDEMSRKEQRRRSWGHWLDDSRLWNVWLCSVRFHP